MNMLRFVKMVSGEARKKIITKNSHFSRIYNSFKHINVGVIFKTRNFASFLLSCHSTSFITHSAKYLKSKHIDKTCTGKENLKEFNIHGIEICFSLIGKRKLHDHKLASLIPSFQEKSKNKLQKPLVLPYTVIRPTMSNTRFKKKKKDQWKRPFSHILRFFLSVSLIFTYDSKPG